MSKILYKPLAMVFSVLGGLLAAKVFKQGLWHESGGDGALRLPG